MGGLRSVRKAKSALGPHSATERRKCKCRVTLLLRDVDCGQTDHMAAEPTHGPHHSCSSSSWLGAGGPFLAIANLQLDGGSIREAVEDMRVRVPFVRTCDNIADFFTKPLASKQFFCHAQRYHERTYPC